MGKLVTKAFGMLTIFFVLALANVKADDMPYLANEQIDSSGNYRFDKAFHEGMAIQGQDSLGSLVKIESKQPIKRPENLIEEEKIGAKQNGYIVKLKDKPVLVKKKELEQDIELKQKEVAQFQLMGMASMYNAKLQEIAELKQLLPVRIKNQRNDLVIEHTNAKTDILQRINRPLQSIAGTASSSAGSLDVMGEYYNTFNGMALDISKEEAEEIKKSPYVEDVYPNLIVEATLMESVPLVNADDVWQLDGEGGSCRAEPRLSPDDLTFFSVTILVLDNQGNPVEGVKVRAYGEDSGIDFPINEGEPTRRSDLYSMTSSDGEANIELVRGRYTIYGGKELGNDEAVYFELRDQYIQSSETISIQLSEESNINVEVESSALDNYRVYASSTSGRPYLNVLDLGEVSTTLKLYTNPEAQPSLLIFKNPEEGAAGYMFIEDYIGRGDYTIQRGLLDLAKLTFSAYDENNVLGNFGSVSIKSFDFAQGNYRFSFDTVGTSELYLDPQVVGLDTILRKDGYSFDLKDLDTLNFYDLSAGDDTTINFGGPFTQGIMYDSRETNMLKTHLWVTLYDNYGNLVVTMSKPEVGSIPELTIKNNGEVIPLGDAEEQGSPFGDYGLIFLDNAYLDRVIAPGEGYTYDFTADLGPFGQINVQDAPLDIVDNINSRVVTQTQNLEIEYPSILGYVFNQDLPQYLQQVYSSMMAGHGDIDLFEEVPVLVYYWGMRDRPWAPIYWHLSSPLNKDTYELIAHEMGHGYTGNEPFVMDDYDAESYATLVGVRALHLMDPEFGTYLMGNHPLIYHLAKTGSIHTDGIEKRQGIEFYIWQKLGYDSHEEFVGEWSHGFMDERAVLGANGFDFDEIMATLYSSMIGENVAWLFRLADIDVADEKVEQGLDLIGIAIEGGECLTGEGITIAVLDSGIDYTHPDLGGLTPPDPQDEIFKKIHSGPFITPVFIGEGSISIYYNKVAYFSDCKIQFYDLDGSIGLPAIEIPDICPVSGAIEGNNLVYLDYDGSSTRMYYYNIGTEENRLIRDVSSSSVGRIDISGDYAAYYLENEHGSVYAYNIPSANEYEISSGNIYGSGTASISDNIIIYGTGSGDLLYPEHHIFMYDISDGQTTELPIEGILIDFRDDLLLFQRVADGWALGYALYDILTGEITPIIDYDAQALNSQEISISDYPTIYYSRTTSALYGRIGRDIIVFNDPSNPSFFQDLERMFMYVFETGQVVEILDPAHRFSFEVDSNNICAIDHESPFNYVFCHTYDLSIDYSQQQAFNDKVIGGYDFINEDNDPMDDNGHGTHCAGIAAGKSQGEIVDNYAYKEGDYVGIGEYLVIGSEDDNEYKIIIEVIDIAEDVNNIAIFSFKPLDGEDVNYFELSIDGDYAYFQGGGYYIKADLISKTVSFTWGSEADYDNPGSFVSEFNIDKITPIGLNGVAPDAKLYAYKVLNEVGSGEFNYVISAIDLAVDPNQDMDFSDHVDVISISLGARNYYWCESDELAESIINAIDLGVVFAISAGNEGGYGNNTISYPGCMKDVITVGSTTKHGYEYNEVSYYSSRGFGLYDGKPILKPDIVAPGQDICSAQYDDAYSWLQCLDEQHVKVSGTSMSAPHVAGAAALLKQAFPNLDAEEIKSLIVNQARKEFYWPHFEEIYTHMDTGAGLLDVLGSMNFYLDNKLIASPSTISFGIVDDSLQEWSQSETINVLYDGLDTISATISVEGDFPEEMRFEHPSDILISSLENAFEFSVYANENLAYGYYEGFLIINISSEIIRIPFFFKKIQLEVKLDKELTNFNINLHISSEVPLSSIDAVIYEPGSGDIETELILEHIDSQNYKGVFYPTIDGEHLIKVEAIDELGNTLYGENSFVADLTEPELELSIDNMDVSLMSNEDISTRISQSERIRDEYIVYPTLGIDNKDEKYINYVSSTSEAISFNWDTYLYNKHYHDRDPDIMVVNGPELFSQIRGEDPIRNWGTSLDVQTNKLFFDSQNQMYSIFKIWTNNGFCGVDRIGMRRFDKETNRWQTVNDNILNVDHCTDDPEMCADPASYHDEWCDTRNGKFDKYLYNLDVIQDGENFYIFWTEPVAMTQFSGFTGIIYDIGWYQEIQGEDV